MPLSQFFLVLWRKRWVALSIVLGAFLAFSIACPRPPETIVKEILVPDIKIVEKIKTEYVDRKIIRLVPTQQQIAKIEKKTNFVMPKGDILKIGEIPKLCEGGTVIVTLDPEGKTDVRVYPNKERWMQFLRQPFAAVEVTQANNTTMEIGANMLRIGRANFSLKAGAQFNEFTNPDWFIKARMEVRF